MIELDSVVVVLVLEVLAVLLLLILGFLLFSKNKRSKENAASHYLINKLEKNEHNKAETLRKLVSESCVMEKDELTDWLAQVSYNDKLLYKQIIKMFLNRDVKLLTDIDKHVDNLSKPYFKLLDFAAIATEESEEMKAAKNKINNLIGENKLLTEQLSMAKKTMDEISAEYTRVFSGTQTELELENSSKKMLKTFKYAEQQVKASVKKLKANEL
ncbi:MAG: hypothetical protein KAT04_07290 [Methylococcales bacterium]|nr:hypothetical protein [Methylococcales bacterium]